MKRLLCLGLTRSYLERWIQIADELETRLVIMDLPERLEEVAEDLRVEWRALESADAGRALLQIRADNNAHPFDGIFTSKDEWLTLVAQLALEFGLPGVNPETARRFAEKNQMKALARDAGLAHARGFTGVDAIDAYPVIVKPADRSGSTGIFECADAAAVTAAIAALREISPGSPVVIEEKITGQEISIEALVLRGAGRVMGVTEKFLFPDSFVERGHISPYAGDFRERAAGIVDAIVARVPDLEFGALHVEGFIRGDEFFVGEIHLRFAGDSIITLTEKSAGVRMIDPVFRAALGLPAELPVPAVARGYAGISFRPKTSGAPVRSSGDRVAGEIRCAPSRAELIGELFLGAEPL